LKEQEKDREELLEDLKLIRADIVILADAHNPSILSPDWLRENCGIQEEPEQVVYTPDFSLFDSESVQITADQVRVQIISKVLDNEALIRTAEIASRYVNALPHIPYAAVGLNYVWRWQGPHQKQPQVALFISDKAIPSHLDIYDITCGGILYGTAPDHRMRVQIEILTLTRVTFNFNFHFDIKARQTDIIKRAILSFGNRNLASQDIIKSLIAGGEQ